MSLIILTNNPKVNDYLLGKCLNAVYIDGHAKDVISSSCDYIYVGWRLAADPLAGYLSRPNPYHTIFLQKDPRDRVRGEDLVRLKRASQQWERYDNIIPMTDRLYKDYEELDFSIAVSTLEGLTKTQYYYNCISE
jgi:hypothetical protein